MKTAMLAFECKIRVMPFTILWCRKIMICLTFVKLINRFIGNREGKVLETMNNNLL
jgi:hypothetical protein